MYDESVWIGKTLLELKDSTSISPLLNVGSSTAHFREVQQKCIHDNIFGPLKAKGVIVHHLDMKKAEGVDIVGDLSEPIFLEQLRKTKYKSVLCSNLLEHVKNPELICKAIYDIVEQDGYIVISVPNLFPYHNDPIDTKFRPGIKTLQSMFPETELVKGDILTIDNTHLRVLLKQKKLLLFAFVRVLMPFYKFGSWVKIIADIPNLNKKYKVTCVTLKKTGKH